MRVIYACVNQVYFEKCPAGTTLRGMDLFACGPPEWPGLFLVCSTAITDCNALLYNLPLALTFTYC